GRHAVAGNLDLEASLSQVGRVDAFLARDVAHRHCPPQTVAVGRGGRRAYHASLAPDRLVAEGQRLGIVENEVDEARGDRAPALGEERLAADEGHGLAEGDGEAEARL